MSSAVPPPDPSQTPADPPEEDLLRPATASTQEPTPTPEQPAASLSHDPYAVLKLRDFRDYLSGWMLMVLGGQVQSVAVGWEVYTRNGKPFDLAMVGLVQALPIILFSLPAGAWADRYNRKKIVLISSFMTALSSLALAVLSWTHAPLYLFFITLFVSNMLQATGRPARQAMVPSIVPKHLFANAMTWNSSIFQISSMTGPAIGGLIVAISPAAAYLTFAGLTMLFTLQLTRVKGNFIPQSNNTGTSNQRSKLTDLTEGIRFVFSTRIIFATILLDLMAVLLGGAAYLLPVYARDILHTNATGFGILRAAEAVGSLLMGLYIAHRPPFKNAGNTLLLAVAGFGASVILFGVSTNFYLSVFALLLMGAFDNISVIIRHTLVTLLAPDDMRGRVNAVNTIFIGSSNELGGFRAGTMASMFGAVTSVVVGGVGTLLSVVYIAMQFPQVRRLKSLNDLRPEEPAAAAKPSAT